MLNKNIIGLSLSASIIHPRISPPRELDTAFEGYPLNPKDTPAIHNHTRAEQDAHLIVQ